LRFIGTPVVDPFISRSSDTKLGLERSTSKKLHQGVCLTRASAYGQTPQGGSLSFGARSKGGFGIPTFHFLHPAASASNVSKVLEVRHEKVHTCNVETKQARVLAQSCQYQRHGTLDMFTKEGQLVATL
jgi:hypothetical protein